jgi:hypothetical protein
VLSVMYINDPRGSPVAKIAEVFTRERPGYESVTGRGLNGGSALGAVAIAVGRGWLER